ncbi:MAG: phosphatase PAP2 family protein, partial [Ignavibacteria bacterium]|nr:phosphatase PAP2 family protein [Ignavibacteria bacterium]
MIKFTRKYFLFFLIISPSFLYSQLKPDTSFSDPKNPDVSIFRAINNGRNGFSDAVIPIIDKSVLPIAIALPLGLGAVSRLNENYYEGNTAALMLLSEVTSSAVVFGLKNIIKRERPYANLKNVHFNKTNSPTDRYSFPSGHTATAFSMATILTLRYPDEPFVIAGSFLYAGFVGYGRMYLGVHYPSDVFTGMLIGAGSSALMYSLRKEIINAKNNLFNEPNRPDSDHHSFTPAFYLAGFILTDIINYKLLQSNLGILSNASVSIDPGYG